MLMGPPFRAKRKPDVDMRLYTRAVHVMSRSRSSCAESAHPAAGLTAVVLSVSSMCDPHSSDRRSLFRTWLVRRRGSNAAHEHLAQPLVKSAV